MNSSTFNNLPQNLRVKIYANTNDVDLISKLQNPSVAKNAENEIINKVIQQKMPRFVHIIHFLQMYLKFKSKKSKDKLSKLIKNKLFHLKYNEIIDLAEVMGATKLFNNFHTYVNTARVNKLSRVNHVEDFLVAISNSPKYKSNYVQQTLKNDYRYIVNQNNDFPNDNLYNLSRKLTRAVYINGQKNRTNHLTILSRILRERNNNVSNNEER